MKCPICKKEVAQESDFFPFCSERCKIIDLGNWASEKYVVSTPIQPDESSDPEGRSDQSLDEPSESNRSRQ